MAPVMHSPVGYPDAVLSFPDCLMMTPALFSQATVMGNVQNIVKSIKELMWDDAYVNSTIYT